MYYVYILQSLKTGKLYIGHTDNLSRRLEEHNTSRGGTYTRQNGPWILVYSENHPDRPSAINRERYLKSTRGYPGEEEIGRYFNVKYNSEHIKKEVDCNSEIVIVYS